MLLTSVNYLTAVNSLARCSLFLMLDSSISLLQVAKTPMVNKGFDIQHNKHYLIKVVKKRNQSRRGGKKGEEKKGGRGRGRRRESGQEGGRK